MSPRWPLLALWLASTAAAPPAPAQAFVLDAPTLRVGEAARALVGAPLETDRFEGLRLDLPGVGALTVSDQPFARAVRAGEFDGRGLFVTVDGVSVRLVGQRALLPGRPTTPAFARLDLDARDVSRFARVSLVDPDARARDPLAVLPAGPTEPPAALPAARPAADRPAASRAADWLPTENLTALDAERAALRAERLALEAERAHLAQERAALEAERAGRAAAPPGTPMPRPALPGPRTDDAPVSLPDLDVSRVQNAPEVLDALAALHDEVRRRGVRGDALVLFVTDPTGRVVRTAVAQPLGGGLDALAEDLVQRIRFVPPLVEGQPAVVRSQVTVRFAP